MRKKHLSGILDVEKGDNVYTLDKTRKVVSAWLIPVNNIHMMGTIDLQSFKGWNWQIYGTDLFIINSNKKCKVFVDLCYLD